MSTEKFFLTEAQLQNEIKKCEYCEEKPCQQGCPADCSPFDFIIAAKVGEDQDYLRSAALIMKNNPLGGVCGAVCPDRHCMALCSHRTFDGSVKIPEIQAAIVEKAKQLGGIPAFRKENSNGKSVAVVGAGPAGLGAAALLAQKGYKTVIFEEKKAPGGMCNLIPGYRLPREILMTDIDFVKSLGDIVFEFGKRIDRPEDLLKQNFDAVIVATGLWIPIMPGTNNEELAVTAVDYLSAPKKYKFRGNVAVIGGGATAVDCAVTAKREGALKVEMMALETIAELPLTEKERKEIVDYGIEVSGRTRVTGIRNEGKKIKGLHTVKVSLPDGKKFSLKDLKEIKGTDQTRNDIADLIVAIGHRPVHSVKKVNGVFYAGDMLNGPTTVVEATASGKNTALLADAFIMKSGKPAIKKQVKSFAVLSGYIHTPVSLETDFFGRKISTPFLLSAAPPSDGYDQMKKAYEKGWSGGVMKTAFDNVPIHIPGEYMHVFDTFTFGNCDNVSGHSLDRVSREIGRLVKEYPDRLTMASTGGPVTGNDEEDKKGWQFNTRKLENSGTMGIEYSLSCPQGGDGTEGDIVSQSPALT
ncbi:MAG TPA: FAD-dependent oxidoreductase, partial [bacterium]|nr:FAD-dependent oxidoreductase [bacterium]